MSRTSGDRHLPVPIFISSVKGGSSCFPTVLILRQLARLPAHLFIISCEFVPFLLRNRSLIVIAPRNVFLRYNDFRL